MVATTTRQNAAPDWAAIVIVILSVTAFAVAQGLTFPLISLALEARGQSLRRAKRFSILCRWR